MLVKVSIGNGDSRQTILYEGESIQEVVDYVRDTYERSPLQQHATWIPRPGRNDEEHFNWPSASFYLFFDPNTGETVQETLYSENACFICAEKLTVLTLPKQEGEEGTETTTGDKTMGISTSIDQFIRNREHTQKAIDDLNKLHYLVDHYINSMTIDGQFVSTMYYSPSNAVKELICSEIKAIAAKKKIELDQLESQFCLTLSKHATKDEKGTATKKK